MMTERATTLQDVAVADIIFSPFNRRAIDEATLLELAQSIQEHGLIEPVILRPHDGRYEIVAGERRVRAARLVKLSHVPALVRRDLDDRTALELMIVENLQREQANPILEAEMLDNLVRMHEGDVTEAARRIGRSKVYVTDRLDLLSLPGEVQSRIRAGELTLTHGKALADLAESDITKNRLARELVETGTSAAQLKRNTSRSLNRNHARIPFPTTTPEIGRRLVQFAGKAWKLAGETLKVQKVTLHLHPAAETWIRVKPGTEAGEFAGQVRQVKTFYGAASADRSEWRVQFTDGGSVAWAQVERLANSADAVKVKG